MRLKTETFVYIILTNFNLTRIVELLKAEKEMIKEATKLPIASRLNVRISEVESPGKFWVQITNDSQHLDLLEEELKIFYESDDALRYELLWMKPCPGHYIAFYVKEDLVWYRGLVRCYTSPNKAEVSLIFFSSHPMIKVFF